MDKKAAAVPVWSALGFGHAELGGVTLHPQPGNPAPRMFRAIAGEALVNRMGFNNPGAAAMAETLARWKQSGLWPKHPIGMNLGKSKITPLEEAAADYVGSFRLLRDCVDFFVVNVSSPNTPNLRQLQDKAALDEILRGLQKVNSGVRNQKSELREPTRPEDHAPRIANHESPPPRPILVKIAPDLSFEAIDEILELVGPRNLAGIVATNTTISRPETGDPRAARTYAETGGLSGRPLRDRSTACIRHIHRQTNGRVPIVGVGGIFTAEDAWEKITAGASLVQIYTGLVYEGPGIVRAIVEGLRDKLAEAGMRDISEAVGIG
jgi:dihydroorotate dehydrogenase